MTSSRTSATLTACGTAALLVVACGGAPSPNPKTDPAPSVSVVEPNQNVEQVDAPPPVRVTEAEPEGDLSSPEGLAAAVVAALRAGDTDAAMQLVIKVEDVTALCPEARRESGKWKELLAEFRGKLQKRWMKHFHQCRTAFDFSAAHIVEVKPKRVEKEGPKKCGAPVESIDDITVVVQSGHSRYTFRIDDAVHTLAGWKSADPLRCPPSHGTTPEPP